MSYSLDFCHSLDNTYKTQYNLDDSIIEMIASIETIINDKNYCLTPIFNYKSKIKTNRNEIDNIISQLKSSINKISDKNFNKQYEKILELLKQLEKNFESKDIVLCANIIFEIASNNLFYSELYAKMFSQLYNEFDFIKKPLVNTMLTFIESYKNIDSLSDSDNYEMFCAIIKNNEKRLALLKFLIYLMKYNILNQKKIIGIAQYIKGNITNKLESDNNTKEIEFMSENLFLILKEAYTNLEPFDEWQNIVKYIEEFKDKKPHKSLSYKTIFKYMDMQDFICKMRESKQDIK